jgi:hypothetical protein
MTLKKRISIFRDFSKYYSFAFLIQAGGLLKQCFTYIGNIGVTATLLKKNIDYQDNCILINDQISRY